MSINQYVDLEIVVVFAERIQHRLSNLSKTQTPLASICRGGLVEQNSYNNPYNTRGCCGYVVDLRLLWT